MKISTLKIIWCYLTGGGTKVADYILDVANNWVAALGGSTREKMAATVAVAKKIISTIDALAWMIPAKWEVQYYTTVSALADVVSACEDLNLSPDELTQVCDAWRIAYTTWRADD